LSNTSAHDFDVKLVPVRDPDGEIILYDIFVNGGWIGSRRTIPQATEAQAAYKLLTTTK
jgi:hypothetical protein